MNYDPIQPWDRFALTNGGDVLPQGIVAGKAVIIDDGKIVGIDQKATLSSDIAK